MSYYNGEANYRYKHHYSNVYVCNEGRTRRDSGFDDGVKCTSYDLI